MNSLLVVNHARCWMFDSPAFPAARVMTAQAYLTEPGRFDPRLTRIINLAASGAYQDRAWYVSQLAAARGQQPLPDPRTLADLASPALIRLLTPALQPLLARAPTPAGTGTLEFYSYFGRTPEKRWCALAAQLFALLPAPLLKVSLAFDAAGWHLAGIGCFDCDAVPGAQRAFMREATAGWLQASGAQEARRKTAALAILHDPAASEQPSNTLALQKFVDAAEQLQMHAELITRRDLARLPEFDALFIRATTHVNHYTYQAARQAALQGAAVIDDADSIIRCCNKIYLAELLARHHIRQPRSMLVQGDNLERTLQQVIATLGLPCVLKQPDGAFSRGILKAETAAALEAGAHRLLQDSALILAQEYLPTAFDWRIGILDRRPLFACKYFMVPGHWQIVKNDRQTLIEGKTEALPLAAVPGAVLRIALQAANLIGAGFYGVDVKQVGGRMLRDGNQRQSERGCRPRRPRAAGCDCIAP